MCRKKSAFTCPEPRRRKMRPNVDRLMASLMLERKFLAPPVHWPTGFLRDDLPKTIVADFCAIAQVFF